MDRGRLIGEALRQRPADEPLWEAISHAVLQQHTDVDQVPDKDRIASIRVVVPSPTLQGEYLKAQYVMQHALADAIAERTGTDAATDMFPRIMAGAVMAATQVAMERWIMADPPVALGPLMRRALRQLTEAVPAAESAPVRPAAGAAPPTVPSPPCCRPVPARRNQLCSPARPNRFAPAPARRRPSRRSRRPARPPLARPPRRPTPDERAPCCSDSCAPTCARTAGRSPLVVLLQLVQTLATLYLPTLNADIIDNGVITGDTHYILRTGGIMLAVTLVQIVCAIGAVYFGARTAMAARPGRAARGLQPGAGRSPPARSASSARRR